jgi:hypothetical protein
MGTNEEDDRERPSWREIDQRKDRSAHVSHEKPAYKKSKRSEWAQKQYLKEVEKLFLGKKGTEEYKKACNEIHNRHGTAKFSAVVKHFIKDYGLPDDWDTLFLLLDYKEVEIVQEVITRLKKEYPLRGLTEMQGFKAKLEILAMTTENHGLRKVIEEALTDM